MATLYERITGVGLTGSGPSEQKIGIHSFVGAVYEQQFGKITGAQAVSAFNLDAGQITAAQTFLSLLNAAPDKTRFMRVFKNIAYMAESGDFYLTQAEFLTRLQEEVTDQGGTLP